MPIISFSLPQEEISAVSRLASDQNRSRSQIVQEAINRYDIQSRWQELRRIGDRIAKELDIESDEDVERIAG